MRYLIPFICVAGPALADSPKIEAVEFQGGRFEVTLSHPDTGWDHYADGWRVEDAQGNVLGVRVLAHPHVNEQPFTRGLGGVSIPEGTRSVYIRSRCLIDGWSSETVMVNLVQSP